jgi:hypothetical protein
VGNAIRAGDAAEKAGDAFASDHDKKVAREQAEKDAKKGK